MQITSGPLALQCRECVTLRTAPQRAPRASLSTIDKSFAVIDCSSHVNLKFAHKVCWALWQKRLRSQNLVSGLGPFEGLRVSVVQVNKGTDVGLELSDGGVDTSLWLFSSMLRTSARFGGIGKGQRYRAPCRRTVDRSTT